MADNTPDIPFNVYMGENRTSRLSWEDFKDKVETLYGWTYDSETKEFYEIDRGVRKTLGASRIKSLAFLFSYFEDMSEYIEDA